MVNPSRHLPSRNSPPALAYLLLITALCAPLSHLLWWQRLETVAAGTTVLLGTGTYLLEVSLTLAVAAVAGGASYSVFRQRTITWPAVAAVPILLSCTIRGSAALSIGTLNGAFGGGAFASLVMTTCALASSILIALHMRQSYRTSFAFTVPISVLGVIAAVCTVIIFFGNGWYSLFAQIGSRWSTTSMWFAWSSLLALMSALGAPLLAGLATDARLSLSIALGGVLELCGIYGSLVWLGLDGSLIMSNLVLFLGAAGGLLVAITLIRFRELRSAGESFASLVGAV